MHLSNVMQHPEMSLPLSLASGPMSSASDGSSADSDGNQSSRNPTINTILIADDSKTERTHLKQILETAGYQVLVASSGKQALSMAESALPDLILLDIIMEDGDGYQACRSLKRNSLTQDIPVIMVSSKQNTVDQQWAKKLGAIDYIVKPYSDTELLQRLNQV